MHFLLTHSQMALSHLLFVAFNFEKKVVLQFANSPPISPFVLDVKVSLIYPKHTKFLIFSSKNLILHGRLRIEFLDEEMRDLG